MTRTETQNLSDARPALCSEASSYATRENAIRKLNKTVRFERRWIIIAQPDGRFSPAIFMEGPEDMHYAHHGIVVLG